MTPAINALKKAKATHQVHHITMTPTASPMERRRLPKWGRTHSGYSKP